MSEAFAVQMKFGPFVMAVHILVDCRDQFLYIVKHTPAKALLSPITEESLDHVQPRGAGTGEVNVIASEIQ